MRIMRRDVIAGAVLFSATLPPATAQTGWEVVKTFQIGGQGGWDYLTVDPQANRLYVPRGRSTLWSLTPSPASL